MDPLVIALVAGSAVLHVAWNVRLKTAGDPLRAATIGNVAAAIVIVPAGIVAWWLDGRPVLPTDGVILGVVSGVVEAAYFILLSSAYRRGDLSVVYPIARGTAPLLAVGAGTLVIGERLGPAGSVGVALLLAGFLWHQRPWRFLPRGAALRDRRADAAILFALATGVTIATYSALDRVGSRLIDPIPYAGILWATCSLCLVAWSSTVARARNATRARAAAAVAAATGQSGPAGSTGSAPAVRAGTRSAVIGGLLSLVAYVAILFALSVAPLTGVAPLRESSIVLASAWGAVRLREATDRGEAMRRILASALIVAGAVLLALDR